MATHCKNGLTQTEKKFKAECDRAFKRVINNPDIYPKDRKALDEILPTIFHNLGITYQRYRRHLYSAERVAKGFKQHIGKPMVDAEHKDILRIKELIDSGDLTDKGTVQKDTVRDFLYFLKRFYQTKEYLAGKYEYVDDKYPPLVEWIKPSRGTKSHTPITKEDLISKEELSQLVEASKSLRNKTMWLVAAAGGFRSGEFRGLKVSDVEFTEHGAKISIAPNEYRNLKNDYSRRTVPIIGEGAVYLKKWLNVHPYRDDPDALLWVSDKASRPDDGLSTATLHMALKRDLAKIGITSKTRNIKFNIFRHTLNTELYRDGLSPHLVKQLSGHAPNSKVGETVYTHTDTEDLVNGLKKHYGLEDREDDEGVTCKVCGHTNKATWLLCASCQSPLKEGLGDKEEYITREEHAILEKRLEDLLNVSFQLQKQSELAGIFIERLLKDPEATAKIAQEDENKQLLEYISGFHKATGKEFSEKYLEPAKKTMMKNRKN